jgi:hypothetical protein
MVVSLVGAQATGCGGEEVCQQVRDWSNEFDEDLQRWPKALSAWHSHFWLCSDDCNCRHEAKSPPDHGFM